ncbi:uncharacterized protein PG986_011177 [Apiospora aurea]|uniref:Uncharacterized protein n=1 Tax=Apiospora aurea TaxID=335848 RepID=A0ABR1Q4T6_9PEZI
MTDESEEDRERAEFCRSDAPSPEVQPETQPEAPMESLSTPLSQSVEVEVPLSTPIASPARPSTPPPAAEESAKRKFSLVSDYDDDTQQEGSPTKRQRTQSPIASDVTVQEYDPEAPSLGAVEEYDPTEPALGAPTWSWTAVNSSPGSQIPGLTLAPEPAASAETQDAAGEGEVHAEDTELSPTGVPSYIA